MPRVVLFIALLLGLIPQRSAGQGAQHPDTSGPEWSDLFASDLEGALRPGDVWSVEDGVLTAT